MLSTSNLSHKSGIHNFETIATKQLVFAEARRNNIEFHADMLFIEVCLVVQARPQPGS